LGEEPLAEVGPRELAHLIAEEGLSPREAAARLGIPESAARAAVARWYASSARSRPSHGRRRIAGVAAVLAFVPVGWVASAALFGDDAPSSRAPAATTASATHFTPAAARAHPAPHTSLAAHAKRTSVEVHRHPRRRSRHETLAARELDDQRLPLVMLVTGRRRAWVRVQLPTRPNHSSGWVRESDVRLRTVEWRLRIDLSDHTVTTWRGTRRISVHDIGVGRSVTPTPRGRYYLTDLIRPTDPGGLYGSFAFGLSAHSDVITSFGDGDGQIGIHGTNDDSGLGTDVSHGCIRVENSVIESFARHLPLGTPVIIRS
jgi:hypothetical protein